MHRVKFRLDRIVEKITVAQSNLNIMRHNELQASWLRQVVTELDLEKKKLKHTLSLMKRK